MIAPAPIQPLSLPLRTPCAVPRLPLRSPEVRPRFTLDGSQPLEDHLELTCAQIAAGIRGLIPRRRLAGIWLGGGYGRGEGGVLRTPARDRPYNDLEFYVFLRGNRHLNERRFGRALHVLGEILTPQAGVDVEFKIASLRELAAGPISMFSYDLVVGHRGLAGSEDLLAGCAHHRDAEKIPLSEATRLLMNRCSGLLLARQRLEQTVFTPADADFVQRNIAKAELALGDALLVAFAQYHWSVRERHRLVERLTRTPAMPWLDEVRRGHAAGVAFKLHPARSTASRETLKAQLAVVTTQAAQVWLWIEQQRLGRTFASLADYASESTEKCAELTGLRSAMVNLNLFAARALKSPARLPRHPRERILNTLPLLLWTPALLHEPPVRAVVQRELQTTADDPAGLMHAYRTLWSRVN